MSEPGAVICLECYRNSQTRSVMKMSFPFGGIPVAPADSFPRGITKYTPSEMLAVQHYACEACKQTYDVYPND